MPEGLTDASFLVLITGVFLFAAVIKGTLGIGLPAVSVGVMSQFLPPHTAIAVVVFPLVFSNIWQVIRARAGWTTLRRYWVLAALLAGSLWITTYFTARMSADFLLGVIGVTVVVFAVSSLIGTPPRLPDRFDRLGQSISGLSAGVMGGFTSIWSPPLVIYLVARRIDGDEFVRATGLLISIGSVPLVIGFWQADLLNGATAPLSAAMLVPTLIGFTIGERIRKRLNPRAFRLAVIWLFLLMGLNLLRRAFF